MAEAAAAAGLASLVSVRVVHCAHAFGCVLTGRAGWKLAFRWAGRGLVLSSRGFCLGSGVMVYDSAHRRGADRAPRLKAGLQMGRQRVVIEVF